MEKFLKVLISPNVLISIVIAIIAIVVVIALKKLFKKYMKAKYGTKYVSTSVRTVTVAAKYIVIVFAVLLILQINGVNISSAVAGLGIAGAVVGLALQDIFKDVIMGVHIMVDKFFSIGDVVKYGDTEGVVISLNVRTTKIRSIYDNSTLSICNRNISEVTKISGFFDIDLPLSYSESVEKIDAALGDACKTIAKIKGCENCVYKGMQDFADSAVMYKLRVFCPPKDKPEIRRAALRVISKALTQNNLVIPYNTLSVEKA